MSLSEADLHAYFDRIGFSGEARPDRETLAALVAAHTGTIPFENLNPLLGLPVPLDTEALVGKLGLKIKIEGSDSLDDPSKVKVD